MHPWFGKSRPERKATAADFKKWYNDHPEQRIAFGASREDGRVFGGYNVDSKDGECWITSEARARGIARMRKWFSENREEVTAKNRLRYATDEEFRCRLKKSYSVWRKANLDKMREYLRRWKEKNPERYKEQQEKWNRENIEDRRRRGREYGRRFPEKVNANTARRWAAKKRQLHPAHDKDAEVVLRCEARRLTRETGIRHHLDHIIPLAHGGWHHHQNLHPLPSTLNLSKNDNPFWEHPGYKSWRDVPEHLWPAELAPEYRERMRKSA